MTPARSDNFGVFYTTDILSDFLCEGGLTSLLGSPPAGAFDPEGLRIADLACGAGALLAAAARALLRRGTRPGLRHRLIGQDLQPDAVARTRLALAGVEHQIAMGDTADIEATLARLSIEPGSLDLVIGNPPWGGTIDATVWRRAEMILGLAPGEIHDSWELFTLLGLHVLRPGGVLALVLPDSLLYPEKRALRRRLLGETTIEKLHYLGPGWFGPGVRMATVLLQARKGRPAPDSLIAALRLGGARCRRAVRGEITLWQLEAQLGRRIPQARSAPPDYEIEVSRDLRDDAIIASMIDRSTPLGDLCDRQRGEEINKAGVLWECPGCLGLTTPGRKQRGGMFAGKPCPDPDCRHALDPDSVRTTSMVLDADPGPAAHAAPFIDGDDVNRRYQQIVPRKWIRLDLADFSYKPAAIYKGPKLLIRQAGVGITATLDETDARCPQSVYLYRLREERRQGGPALEFLLGALLSRTMAYFTFKRWSEVDPAKAYAKLTHERLATLPIPRVDLGRGDERRRHDRIVENVRRLLAREASLGGAADREIEADLRALWGLDGEAGAYVHGELADLEDSQPLRDLFPDGRPRRVRRIAVS